MKQLQTDNSFMQEFSQMQGLDPHSFDDGVPDEAMGDFESEMSDHFSKLLYLL